MRYATSGHSAQFTDEVYYGTPFGELKIEYQGPRGEYTLSELGKIAKEWREYGWKVDIGQMIDERDEWEGGEYIITPFLGEDSIRTDWFTLVFTRGNVRMAVNFDQID